MPLLFEVFASALIIALVGCGGDGQANDARLSPSSSTAVDSAESPRAFVQSFYEWYTPQAMQRTTSTPYFKVLERRGVYITNELALSLRPDSTARVNQPDGPRETLNFDPFLASQDPRCAGMA